MAVRITDGGLNFTASIDDAPLKGSIDSLKAKLKEYEKAAEKSFDKKEIEDYKKKIKETEAEIKRLTNAGKAGFDGLGNNINKSKNSLNSFNNTLKTLGAGLLAYFGIGQVVSFGKQVLDTTAEFQKLEAVLGNTLGSKGVARSAMAMINDIASKTPFSVAELTDSFVKLANRGFTPTAKEIKKLGDLASSTGKSFNQLTEAVLDAMTGENERLKEFGIKAKKHGDMVTYTFKGVKTEVKNSADAIKDYLLTLGDLKGVKGSMDVISETLTGKISNLGDSWDRMLVSIGKNTTGIFTGMISLIDGAISKITNFNNRVNIIDKYKLNTETDTKKKASNIPGVGGVMAVSDAMNDLIAPIFGGKSKSQQLNTDVEVITSYTKSIDEFILKTSQGAKTTEDYSDAIRKLYNDGNALIKSNSGLSKNALKALAKIYTDAIKTMKEARKGLQSKLDGVSLVKDAEASKKQEADYQDLLKKRLSIIEQINQAQFNYKKAGKTPLQQELDDNNRAYDKLKESAIAFNKLAVINNAKNPKKVALIATGGIDKDRKASDDLINLKYDLSDKKTLYENYYNTIQKIGKTATERFYSLAKDAQGNDIVDYTTYLNQKLDLAKGNAEQTALVEKEIEEVNKLEQAEFIKNLEKFSTYLDRRKVVQENYLKIVQDLTAKGKTAEADIARKAAELELTQMDLENTEKLESYKSLFSGIEKLSRKNTYILIKQLKKELNAIKITSEARAIIERKINALKVSLKNEVADDLIDASNALYQVAGAVASISESFADVLNSVSKAVNGYAQILNLKATYDSAKTQGDKNKAIANLAIVAATEIINIISTITNAAKERKAAEEAYYRAVLEGQRQYNLSLNDTLRLRTEMNESIFLKDKKGRLTDGVEALTAANKNYQKSIDDLANGQAKVGQKNANNWNAIGKTTGSGAVAGAAIGSIVPVVGTVVGAAVGAVVGFFGGLFGAKKKKDVFAPLMDVYPGLVKIKDGVQSIDVELAKSLVANNLVNDATKDLINNTLAWEQKVKDASAQIKSVISDLAGNLSEDLRNALVKSFEDGSDAAKAFGETVSKVVENIVSQFLFNELFSNNFKDLEKNMQDSFGINGDQNLVDDLAGFYKDAAPKIEAFNKGLEAAQVEARKAGFNVFQSDKTKSQGGGMAGAIKRDITETTANVLVGHSNGMRLALIEANTHLKTMGIMGAKQLEIATLHLETAIKIEANTKRTADSSDNYLPYLPYLKTMSDSMGSNLNVALRAQGK